MEPNRKPNPTPREEVVTDLKILTQDAQELLHSTASDVGDRAYSARQSLIGSLKSIQEKIVSLSAAAKDKAETARIATDVYVRDNPWNAVGVATAIGFMVGLGLAIKLTPRDDE